MRRVARPAGTPPNFVCGSLEDGLGGEGGEGSLFGGLPDDGVAADEGEGGVPAPDGDGEVEGGDDADDAEGVPGLHHAVLGALGGNGEAGELAREAGGEGADVDHLLDFAVAFGEDLAGFDGDEAAEGFEVGAKLFAEEADEFAALRGWDVAPLEEGGVSLGDGLLAASGVIVAIWAMTSPVMGVRTVRLPVVAGTPRCARMSSTSF